MSEATAKGLAFGLAAFGGVLSLGSWLRPLLSRFASSSRGRAVTSIGEYLALLSSVFVFYAIRPMWVFDDGTWAASVRLAIASRWWWAGAAVVVYSVLLTALPLLVRVADDLARLPKTSRPLRLVALSVSALLAVFYLIRALLATYASGDGLPLMILCILVAVPVAVLCTTLLVLGIVRLFEKFNWSVPALSVLLLVASSWIQIYVLA